VGMAEGICAALYEHVLIGTRFGDWCMKTFASPDAMFYGATNVFIAWAALLCGQASCCQEFSNNLAAYWMLMSGLGVLVAKWVFDEFRERGIKWGLTRLSVLWIGFNVGYYCTFGQILWVYDSAKPAAENDTGFLASFAILAYLAISEKLIEMLFEDNRRWKWVCGVALLAVVITLWGFQHAPAQAVLGVTQ